MGKTEARWEILRLCCKAEALSVIVGESTIAQATVALVAGGLAVTEARGLVQLEVLTQGLAHLGGGTTDPLRLVEILDRLELTSEDPLLSEVAFDALGEFLDSNSVDVDAALMVLEALGVDQTEAIERLADTTGWN